MAKFHKVIDPLSPHTVDPQFLITDWDKCVLCQEASSEVLHCPAESKCGGAGYQTLASNLMALDEIGFLPKTLKLSRLDDGLDDGIEATLSQRKAKWHDSCRLQFNKTQVQRAQKRKRSQDNPDELSKKFTRLSVAKASPSKQTCFFCERPASGKEPLHNASTFTLDKSVRDCAHKLQDTHLLAKLSAGDLIAQEAKYHSQCLASLYNRTRQVKDEATTDAVNHGIALAELVSYIEDARMDMPAVAPVFKMTDLATLYGTRLHQLGTAVPERIHTTHLKDRLLAHLPGMQAVNDGRNTNLVFKDDLGTAVHKACKQDADNDAIILARAANIVRRDMFKMKSEFTGSFGAHCQEESVPASLLALVTMVLKGPNIKVQGEAATRTSSQPARSVSQLIMYNSSASSRENTKQTRHSKERETPLPIYLGTLIHSKTRKRELVDILFHLGLSISYDRVLDISTDMGNKICQYYEREQAVCPPELKGILFTTAAVDNIDHNPSATTAHGSFHGTGISLFQHPSSESDGVHRTVPEAAAAAPAKKRLQLPESYTTVPPVANPRRDAPIPLLEGPNKTDGQLVSQAMPEEYRYDLFVYACKVVNQSQQYSMDACQFLISQGAGLLN